MTSRTELKDGRYWAATGRPSRTRAIRKGLSRGFRDWGMRGLVPWVVASASLLGSIVGLCFAK